ncbi:hypothetical protein ACFV6I_34230, partial [Kitasatospora sp. NPDC059803]
MRLSLPAAVLAGCTVALLLQPAAATAGPADPDGARRRGSAGGGSVTSLPLGPGPALGGRPPTPRGVRPQTRGGGRRRGEGWGMGAPGGELVQQG